MLKTPGSIATMSGVSDPQLKDYALAHPQAEKEEQAAEESSVPTGLKGPNFLEKWFNNLKEFLNNDIED